MLHFDSARRCTISPAFIRTRVQQFLRHGCNALNASRPVSRPLSFWLDQDIWDYIKIHDIPYAKTYDLGYARTGCMFCLFGLHYDEGMTRLDRMKQTIPLIKKEIDPE